MVNDIVAAKCELIIESNKLAPVCFSIQSFAQCSQKRQHVDVCPKRKSITVIAEQ